VISATEEVVVLRMRLLANQLRGQATERRRASRIDPCADGMEYCAAEIDSMLTQHVELASALAAAQSVAPTEQGVALLAGRAVLCASHVPTEIVYALIDPMAPEIVRYIGRTNTPEARYRIHLTEGSAAIREWVGALSTEGRQPAMVLIERCTVDAVKAREEHWMRVYHDAGQADLNRDLPWLRMLA
jgi:hypothetical protein